MDVCQGSGAGEGRNPTRKNFWGAFPAWCARLEQLLIPNFPTWNEPAESVLGAGDPKAGVCSRVSRKTMEKGKTKGNQGKTKGNPRENQGKTKGKLRENQGKSMGMWCWAMNPMNFSADSMR